jgi:solute carrier family 25 carnitine/acylcarnitine transporter 20/29
MSSKAENIIPQQPGGLLPTGMINYISGVAGGLAVVIVGHPFDTIKTRLMTAPNGYYNGVQHCVKHTIQNEGLRGLYAGVFSPLIGQMFFRAASFATFYEISTRLNPKNADPGSFGSSLSLNGSLLISGGVTGAVISLIETPIDLVKTKLQILVFENKNKRSSSPAAYDNFIGCVRYLSHTQGIRSLFQGFCATTIRNVPANALFFPVNEIVANLCATQQGLDNSSQLAVSWRLVAGACAGLSYWVLTYPLDVIKARVMAAPLERRTTWRGEVASVLRKADWRTETFWRGLLPSAARSVPACACMFATVEYCRNTLSNL